MNIITKLWNRYNTNTQFREFIRFCIVGGICTVIDYTIYLICLLFLPYQASLVLGYCLSLVLNYYLTIHWTFQKNATKKNAIGVVVAHLFNLFVVRMGLMLIFVDFCDLDKRIAYIPMFVISVVLNFIIVRFVVNKY